MRAERKKGVAHFWQGLRGKQPAVLIFAFGLFVTTLVAIEVALRNGMHGQWIPLGFRLTDNKDVFSYRGHQLARLSRSKEKGAWYFLGGSAMAWALQPESFQSKLAGHAIQGNVYHFSAGLQSIGEMILFSEQLPPHSGTVVVGVSPSLFTRHPSDYYHEWRRRQLLLHSSTLNAFFESQNLKNYRVQLLFPQFLWWLQVRLWKERHSLAKLTVPNRKFDPQWWDLPPHPPEKKKKEMKKYLRIQRKRFPSKADFNFQALDWLDALLKRKGLNLLLVELPIHPTLIEKESTFYYDVYRNRLKRWVSEKQIQHIDFTQKTKFQLEDFRDAVHLYHSGREKFESSLAQALGNAGLG